MGLASVEVGLAGHPLLRKISMGTNPWLWTTNAFGLRSYNVRGKFEFYADDTLSLAIRPSFYQFGKGGARIRHVPLEFYGAVRLNDEFTVGTGFKYASLSVRGAAEIADDFDLNGSIGLTTHQFRAMGEWRMSKRTAFILRSSVQQYQQLRGEVSVEAEESGTEGGAFAEKDLLPKKLAYNVSLVAAWSWDKLNLELGLQYGSIEIPGTGAVLPIRTVMPSADLYWRF